MVYLFDFDGTLVDSMPVWSEVMLRILREHQIPAPPDLIKIITPLGFSGTADYFRTLGLELPKEAIIALMFKYAVDEYASRVPVKPNVLRVLQALHARGDRLIVLTASPHPMLDPCLKRTGLWPLFEHVWSCDDFGLPKTDPEIYRRAAERLGVSVEEMIFLDDNYYADEAALRAGAQVIGVYDAAGAAYEAQLRALTERYIYDFSELLPV